MTTAAGHVCWAYDDHEPFDAFGREFLLAGLAAGEQVWYVPGDRPRDRPGTTVDELRGAARRAGAVRVVEPAEAYNDGRPVDPAGQVAVYAAATADAVAAGFTGFRVVADVTALMRTAEQRDAFARYEYLIGRHIRSAPMRAVCGYDRAEVGNEVAAELACLHEASHGAGVTFQLHPGATPAVTVLDGEIDMSAGEVFTAALGHTDLGPPGSEVTVEADGLRFVDHRALIALERFAGPRRITAVLRTRLAAVARLAELLELPHVRVEVTR